jgi:Ca-activated chloride channel family protein
MASAGVWETLSRGVPHPGLFVISQRDPVTLVRVALPSRVAASSATPDGRSWIDDGGATLPVLGPTTLSGFEHPWFFLFLLAILGLVGLYVVVQLARQKRMLRFANMELLDSVAPRRPNHSRHLPTILLVTSLLLFTVAMAGPTHEVRIPRNRAVVMLVIDVSESMRATDVPPSRLAAAQDAAKQFADELTAGINLGLIAYAGTATVLVSPTTNRNATKNAIDKLQLADRTATGEAIFTALQAIATVGAVIGGGDSPPPARIVLFSDGKETVPSNPNNPKGAFTAARTAKDHGVPISTIAFGTAYGYVNLNGQRVPVPVDDATLKKVAELSGGTAYGASNIAELNQVYATLQQQIGYETIRGDASVGWLRLGAVVLACAGLASVLINRRLPS